MEEFFRIIRAKIGDTGEDEVVAYADDQILILGDTSVKRIEAKWEEYWESLKSWADGNKLEYNKAKTERLFITHDGRNKGEPVLKMEEERIKTKEDIKYLGIIIDNKMLYLELVKYIRGKVHDIGNKMRAIANRHWGSSKNNLKFLYENAIRNMIMYGSEIWGKKSNDSRLKKQLDARGCIVRGWENRNSNYKKGWRNGRNINLQNKYKRNTTEELAIKKALEIRQRDMRENLAAKEVMIFMDSLVSIQKIKNKGLQNRQIMETRKLIKDTNTEDKTTWIVWEDRKNIKRIVPEINRLARIAAEQNISVITVNHTVQELKKIKKTEKIKEWQRQWTNINTHRPTLLGHIIPMVGTDRIDITFKTTQLLTGHGNMKSYIERFKLQQTDTECRCGQGQETSSNSVRLPRGDQTRR